MRLRKYKRDVRKKRTQNSEQEGRRNVRFTILSSVTLCVILASFSLVAWNRCSRPSTLGMDYDGVIVDRWAGYTESEYGSRPYFRFLIEDDNRRRFTVNVDAETYHRAQVGMRVSRRKGKVELGNQISKPG